MLLKLSDKPLSLFLEQEAEEIMFFLTLNPSSEVCYQKLGLNILTLSKKIKTKMLLQKVVARKFPLPGLLLRKMFQKLHQKLLSRRKEGQSENLIILLLTRRRKSKVLLLLLLLLRKLLKKKLLLEKFMKF